MLGIFGGTFDPIHNGHLRVAIDAYEQLGLNRVHLIPLSGAVHREQPKASAEHRLAMIERAVEHTPYLIADDREIRRGGDSYMVDTLSSLKADHPTEALCLLLGTDAFNGFDRWRNPEQILQLANLMVLKRPGYSVPTDPPLAALIKDHLCDDLGILKTSPAGKIYFLEVTQLDIASSEIRQKVVESHQANFLLPSSTLEYIQQHQLYR